MPVYTFSATNDLGEILKDTLSAPDEISLERKLDQQGQTLIKVIKAQEKKKKTVTSVKISKRDLTDLAYHLSILSASGISILDSLDDFKNNRSSKRLRPVLEDVINNINQGDMLSTALGKHQVTFGKIFISLVRAGEESGRLDVVMERFYKEMEWRDKIKGQVVQAVVYPSLLVLALTGLVVLLLTFLLPKVMGMYPEGEVVLPFCTQILISCSEFLQDFWPFLVIGLILIPICINILRWSEKGEFLTDNALMKIPIMGGVVRDVAIARFISTFRTLLGSGVEILNALKIGGEASGNCVIKRRALEIEEGVRAGSLLSEAFNKINEFNSMIKNLINMSEKSGQITTSLERITQYYDTTIPRKVKKSISIIEPLIIVTAGAVVSFVLIGTLLPLFNLYSSL